MNPMIRIIESIAEQTGMEIFDVIKIIDNEFHDFTINGWKIENKDIDIPYQEEKKVEGGYINYEINWKEFIEDFNLNLIEENKRIGVDFSSPNIAKPMHIGHLRSTLIGNSLMNIGKKFRNEMIGFNYLGDVGTQFGKLIYAYEAWGKEEELEKNPILYLLKLYVKFHKEANEEMEKKAREINKELENGNPRYIKIWNKIKEMSLKEFNDIYKIFGIKFDVIENESDYIKEAKKISEKLLNMGIAKKREDGSIGYNNVTLIKSDGSTLYFSRDLAAAISRFKNYKLNKMIYVVANEQNYHFEKLFEILKKIGIKNTYHVGFGLVNLESGKLSTRKGRIILLKDLIEKINEKLKNINLTRNSIIFWMLKSNEKKDIMFRWEDLLSTEGKTGVYISYAHARASKLKIEHEFNYVNPNEIERRLLRKISFYPIVLIKSWIGLSPHIIANYLYDLSNVFNEFYEKCEIMKEKEEIKNFRLTIVDLFLKVMEDGMKTIGMVPIKNM